ncbi:unnamed protein product [Rotaria magnacalcarata]|uniref:Uncharacterized protein n=1 Tax=Rotaria magnacalcarata TaxID=392030 RepID=A0A816WVV4_9BILA|nr:unnamed protein product [Rotaria magnacalcarata]CAF2139066.1 unnamed protein product [Rotaria magnacalcarata]CAF4107022.1 unnamed protein product [Rotaria magnacalcarata]CAF4196545.1 unnamed protein product [Rotaria magnacalcarata]
MLTRRTTFLSASILGSVTTITIKLYQGTKELTEMKQSADGFIKHYRISKQLANKLTQELEVFLECIQAGMSSS